MAWTGADELIVAAAIHDSDARLRSYRLVAYVLSAPPAENEAGAAPTR